MARLRHTAAKKPKTISASRIHAAAGISKVSRVEIWLEIACGLKKPASDWVVGLQNYGNVHEYAAVGYVEDVTGRLFFHTGSRQKLYRKGRWTCHPDGEDDEVITEVKSRAPDLAAYKVGDDNWVKHMPQIQQNMYLSDRDSCLFACYVRDSQSALWQVYQSDEYLEVLHRQLEEFHRYVDGEEEIPKRIGRKPKMPEVRYELIDGPSEVVEEVVMTGPLVQSLAERLSQRAMDLGELDAIEDQINADHPGFVMSIIDGTARRRAILEDPMEGF